MRSITTFKRKKPQQTPDTLSLILDSVSKSFKVGRNNLQVLKHASLVIEPGEIVALMGPSGSGKSTLAHIAGGVMRPDSGTITIAGQKIHKMRGSMLAKVRRKSIGFVFQNFKLLNNNSVSDNVAMPLIVSGISPRKRRKAVDEVLKLVSLSIKQSISVSKLSGGERQRVAIARAIIHNPSLIIADEPTGSLDSKNGNAVMKLLLDMTKQKNIATLIVTHDIHIAKQADRIIYMYDGALSDMPGEFV